jgi:predicted SnoaL-like aldol condensation-catalyzing enzyme
LVQHSAHIALGRDGLFNLIRSLPDTLKYESQLIVAEGDYVIADRRFSGHGRPAGLIAADIVRIEDGRLAEHWDVLQTRQPGLNPSAACRCSATDFPTDFPHPPHCSTR